MKEKNINALIGSIVNYGGNTMIIETEEQVQKLIDSIDFLNPITDKDEIEIAKKQLNLGALNEVTKVYRFTYDGKGSIVCLAQDWV